MGGSGEAGNPRRGRGFPNGLVTSKVKPSSYEMGDLTERRRREANFGIYLLTSDK